MVAQVKSESTPEIIYPDSDGKPMADNTLQFRWITTIKTNLDWLFADNDQVFVAGDLLWYPVEGNNKKRQAPDVMVVFGRPKGERGSYQQWKEDHIAPQVVFEILSPGNTQKEMKLPQISSLFPATPIIAKLFLGNHLSFHSQFCIQQFCNIYPLPINLINPKD